jgi:hypothetical protein
MDMHATDLVGINGITRVLLVYTCQQSIYPRGHVPPFRRLLILHRVPIIVTEKPEILGSYSGENVDCVRL